MASEWDLRSGERLRTFEGCHSDSVWAICVDADGGSLYTASSHLTAVQWSLESGTESKRYRAQTSDPNPAKAHVWSLATSGDSLYTGSSDGAARRWHIDSGAMRNTFTGHQGWVTSLCMETELYTGSADGSVRAWDVDSGECTRVYDLPGMCIMSLTHLDGMLFAGTANGEVSGQ